jgi:hypothetical protein
MKIKTLALSVAILLVLAVLARYLQRPPPAAPMDARIGQPVFDVKALERSARLRLADQGKTVLLTKQSGGKWLDSSYYDLPADFSKLSRFIDDLVTARVQRLVTRNPERLARLDFKDASIALLDATGQTLWDITLGMNAEGGGRFVKFDGEPKGYLANLSLYLDADAKNWADSLLIDLKPDDIAGVEIGFDSGEPVAASRPKKAAAWTAAKAPAGQRINSARITSLLGSFGSLRFQDTADLTDPNVAAARQHSRTIRLSTFDHKTITIQLGRKPEERKEIKKQTPEGSGQQAAGKGQKTPNELASSAASANPPAASAAPATALVTQNPAPSPAAEESTKVETLNPQSSAVPPPVKPEEPKFETVPAGPVYAFITSSDASAPVNTLMTKRAFQIFDWNFTSLPQKSDELFELVPAPPSPPKKTDGAKPAEAKGETKPAEPPASPPKP